MAVTAREHRVSLLARLYSHYDRDAEFGAALVGLVPLAEAALDAHGPTPTRTRADLLQLVDDADTRVPESLDELASQTFRQELDAVVATFGLDRLGPDGRAQVFAWIDRYLRARASRFPPSAYGPTRLSTARTSFAFEPEVFGIVPAPWRQEEWAPMREPRSHARARLEKLARLRIKEALDRIEGESTAASLLVHPSSTPQLERDVGWLFQKLRFGQSFEAIYLDIPDPPDGGAETIRKAVQRLAKRLGIDQTGWETGWR